MSSPISDRTFRCGRKFESSMPISSVWHPNHLRSNEIQTRYLQIIPKVTLQCAVSRWLMRFLIIVHRLECGRRKGSALAKLFRPFQLKLPEWISTRTVCPTPLRRISSLPSPVTSISGNYVPFGEWSLTLSGFEWLKGNFSEVYLGKTTQPPI